MYISVSINLSKKAIEYKYLCGQILHIDQQFTYHLNHIEEFVVSSYPNIIAFSRDYKCDVPILEAFLLYYSKISVLYHTAVRHVHCSLVPSSTHSFHIPVYSSCTVLCC